MITASLRSAALVGVVVALAACGRPADARRTAGSSSSATISTSNGSLDTSGAAVRRNGRGANSVEFFPAATLAQAANELAGGTRTGTTLRSRPDLQVIQGRRVMTGGPEVHDAWSDVVFVQGGRAVLVSGGRLEGASTSPGGEHRGGRIAGGSSRAIGAGDAFVIPAGVPHQYEITKGDSLRYLTVKVRPGAR